MERFGLVGLPNAGKSSLYNALTGGGALAAPYAFATTDPNVGVAKVPDHRLDAPGRDVEEPQRRPRRPCSSSTSAASSRGPAQGEGLGNRFLGGIREVDAIVFVLRAFEDDDVPGPTDPLEHLRIVELELALADLETVEAQLEPGARRRPSATSRLADEVAALERRVRRARPTVTPLYRAGLDAEQREVLLQPYFLLTNKPVLAVVNVGEDELDDLDAVGGARSGRSWRRRRRIEVLGLSRPARGRGGAARRRRAGRDARRRSASARARCPGSSAPPTTCSACARSSRPATRRAGPGRSGPAPRRPSAPGVIHTDLQRGFIRAEVIRWDELLEIGSWNKAKELGQAPRRGQGLRGRRRRRPGDPLQRVVARADLRCCAGSHRPGRPRWLCRSSSQRQRGRQAGRPS